MYIRLVCCKDWEQRLCTQAISNAPVVTALQVHSSFPIAATRNLTITRQRGGESESERDLSQHRRVNRTRSEWFCPLCRLFILSAVSSSLWSPLFAALYHADIQGTRAMHAIIVTLANIDFVLEQFGFLFSRPTRHDYYNFVKRRDRILNNYSMKIHFFQTCCASQLNGK